MKPLSMLGSAAVAAALVAPGCGDDAGGSAASLPTEPPTDVSMVATGGFERPGDAVASPDGSTFYFTAFTTDEEDPQPAVFRVPSSGGEAEALHAGGPFAYPTGLVASCDGETLHVADMRSIDEMGEVDAAGALYTLATGGGEPAVLETSGIGSPTGLALSVDCDTLHVTGWTPEGEPALFTVPVGGGAATVVHAGEPLVAPTGVHVDADGVSWVMDHLARGEGGQGMLFAITSDGEVSPVLDALRMGTPGGVSLTAGGGTAVIPTLDDEGRGQLTTVHIASGEMVDVPAPEIGDPAGLRTAREAGVFAVVDSEGGAIFRAE